MTKTHTRIIENVWFHHEEAGRNLAVIILAACIVLFGVIFSLSKSTHAVLNIVVALAIGLVLVFPYLTKSTTIEIDRATGEIRKTWNYLIFTTRKSYPLREFDGVKLLAKNASVEDGYRILRYCVVLKGENRFLELFSVDTEMEGKSHQKELAAFLSTSKNQLHFDNLKRR